MVKIREILKEVCPGRIEKTLGVGILLVISGLGISELYKTKFWQQGVLFGEKEVKEIRQYSPEEVWELMGEAIRLKKEAEQELEVGESIEDSLGDVESEVRRIIESMRSSEIIRRDDFLPYALPAGFNIHPPVSLFFSTQNANSSRYESLRREQLIKTNPEYADYELRVMKQEREMREYSRRIGGLDMDNLPEDFEFEEPPNHTNMEELEYWAEFFKKIREEDAIYVGDSFRWVRLAPIRRNGMEVLSLEIYDRNTDSVLKIVDALRNRVINDLDEYELGELKGNFNPDNPSMSLLPEAEIIVLNRAGPRLKWGIEDLERYIEEVRGYNQAKKRHLGFWRGTLERYRDYRVDSPTLNERIESILGLPEGED